MTLNSIADLPTPSALVDEVKMMHNIAHMQSRMDALGVRFRPHVKTSKCVEVAKRPDEASLMGLLELAQG